jgi:hypothetical protein
MKYPKQFFTLLVAGLLVSSLAQASETFIKPDKVPKYIKFYPKQSNGKTAKFNFQNSALPAKFLCYFDTIRQTKGIRASITSENSIVEFSNDAPSNMIEAGTINPAMFTVQSARGNSPKRSITFTLDMRDSKFKGNSISLTCIMSK